jgi:hypothetical protein
MVNSKLPMWKHNKSPGARAHASPQIRPPCVWNVPLQRDRECYYVTCRPDTVDIRGLLECYMVRLRQSHVRYCIIRKSKSTSTVARVFLNVAERRWLWRGELE